MSYYLWRERVRSFFRQAACLVTTCALLICVSGAWAGPTTQGGPYRVEVTTDPGVIPVGKAKLQVRITDASGKPVEGATVRALTKMPSMDMGEREQPGAPQTGQPGMYSVPAQFAMEGGYEATIQITGPLGRATARLPLKTGQDTTPSGSTGGSFPSPLLLFGGFLTLALALFVAFRMRRTGQQVAWKSLLNRQALGALALLGIMAVGASYAVSHFRRPGALTPVEAQAMDMSYLPPPPGYAPVELASVVRGSVHAAVRYTGTAVGYVEQDIYPRSTGILTYLPLYAGDSVKRGQALARLDTSQSAPQAAEKRAAANTARQGVSVARAEAAQAEAEVGQAHAELTGKQGALAEAQANVAAAREERDNAAAALASARAEVEEATSQVTAAQADQTYWRAQIERASALLQAGAISGEEFGRDRAQADTTSAKVQQAEAHVSQAAAQVRAAQAALRKADAQIRGAAARVQMARSELSAHYSHVRAAQAAVVTSRQKIGQAQSGVAEAQAVAQAAAATQGYAEIRAQTDGVVTQRLISPGVLVSPGQAILRVAQISPLRLQANVAEADLAHVHIGSEVTVTAQNQEGRRPIMARVTTVPPTVDPVARTGIVEAVIPNRDRRFLPGQYVVMEFSTGAQQETLRVPTTALQYRATSEEGTTMPRSQQQPFVWLAEATGQDGQYTVRRVNVKTGVSDGVLIEIAAGLTEGQQVVVTGGEALKEGDTVATVTPAATAPSKTMPSTDAAAGGGHTQTARVSVTAQGFQPAVLTLQAGVPARITFTRTTDQTCATEVVFPDYHLKKALPLNQPVTIRFTPRNGEISFACGMNMVKGKVIAR